MRFIFKSSLLIAAAALTCSSYAQTTDMLIPNKQGSVYANLKSKELKAGNVAAQLPQWLGLAVQNTYKEVSTSTDKLGFAHTRFQQYYNQVLVDGGTMLVHVKDGKITSMNGRIAAIAQMSTNPALSADEAIGVARRTLEVVTLIRQHPEELLVAAVPSDNGETYALAYKVRVDGRTLHGKIQMANVYVDAQTGTVIKKESLIAHADVDATAHTIYSGIRTMTTDDGSAEGYRLRDNARNIETYNVVGDPMSGSGGAMFDAPKDIFNETTTWTEQLALTRVQLSEVGNNGLISGLGFPDGDFIASMAVRGTDMNPETADVINWPDIMLNVAPTASLPLSTNNLYGYIRPEDTSFLAGFAKVNLFADEYIPSDSAFFRAGNLQTPGVYDWADDAGNSGTYEVGMVLNPAVDAHWGMGETHDYYMETFERNSFDGNGSVVKNYVNGVWPIMVTQNNAAALPEPDNAMVYGLGDGVMMNPVVGLDVMGHEFTHMVTDHNGMGGLQYMGESGALNESFSDIFGACIEFRTKGEAANWVIGEDVILVQPGFFRSMSDPKAPASSNNPNFPPQPDTYGQQYWVNPGNMQNDNGGVHINSGVQNKWFYLLCEGGTGTNDNDYDYNVPAIGRDKAEQIAYRNLTTYLTSTSKFIDACNGSLQATIDLFGENSPEEAAVAEAWRAVGLLEGGNAIHAIDAVAAGLKVYPNPSTGGRFTIASENEQTIQAQLFNLVGTSVLQVKVKKGLNNFNIDDLPKGMYLIKFQVGKREAIQKVTVL